MKAERIKTYISICDTHLERLKSALKALRPLIPLDRDKYRKLSDIDISFIDQLSFRFGKLQDTAGRALRNILIALGEDVEGAPFIDILNRAEKIGIIDNAQEWMMLRELRNLLTHEYSEKEEDIISGINKLYEISLRLCDIYKKIKTYSESKGLS